MKRRATGCCIMSIVSVAVLTAAAYYMARPKSLLDRATRASDAFDWKCSILMKRFPRLEFCWLSPTEVLYAVAGEPGRLQLMRKRIDRPNEPPVSVPLTLPEEAMKWNLSPDGRNIIWTEYIPAVMPVRANQSQSPVYVSSLDGTSNRQLTNAYANVWSEDGSRIFTAAPDSPHILRQTLVGSGKMSAISFTYMPPLRRNANWNNLLHAYRDGRLLTVEDGGAFYMTFPRMSPNSPPNTTRMVMDEYDLTNTELSPKTWTVATPANTENGTATISPQGDRLFWQTYTEVVSAPEQMLHRLFKSYAVHPFRYAQLFVSDLQGNRIHLIAEYRPTVRHPAADGPFSSLLWSPDGKKIGFVMKGGFYTIPVD